MNAIAFEAMRPETVAIGGYDRIIIAGEFTKVGEAICNNLAAITKEGLVEWAFGANEGADGPVHAVEVQLDGKVLIGGAFTNVSGAEAR